MALEARTESIFLEAAGAAAPRFQPERARRSCRDPGQLRVLLPVRRREYFARGGKCVRMSGFKNFIMRGNLVELAVAVVIGTQFSGLVKQFVSSFVNPLLSLAGGMPNFGNLTFKAGKAVFSYGQFVTAALSFVISALVVYFILVLPVSRLLQLLERNKAATTRDCPECTMSIPVAARRCPQCTMEITPATEQPQPVG
jgi:large conductance mechanosensitive channel